MSELSAEERTISIPSEKSFLEAQLKKLNGQIETLKQSKVNCFPPLFKLNYNSLHLHSWNSWQSASVNLA